jgi:hypothetical protein
MHNFNIKKSITPENRRVRKMNYLHSHDDLARVPVLTINCTETERE